MHTSKMIGAIGLVVAARIATATLVTDSPAVVNGKTFDFVIIGAGLSGLTVANKVWHYRRIRLAENRLQFNRQTAQWPKLFHTCRRSWSGRIVEQCRQVHRRLALSSRVLQSQFTTVR